MRISARLTVATAALIAGATLASATPPASVTPGAAIVPGATSSRLVHPGLRPGEAYTYVFAVGPIEGARARMSVGFPARQKGRTLVAVQGQAETVSLVSLVAPVNAAYQLVIDADTLLPVEVTTRESGLRERRFHSLVDGRSLALEIVAPQRTIKQKRTLSREPRDPLSAYFALRAHALADGDRLTLDVLDGAALWRAQLHVIAHEKVTLNEDGAQRPPPAPAIRIEGTLQRIDDLGRVVMPKIPKRTITCWLSDDPLRTLLRASFDSDLGRARLELTSYVLPPHAQRGRAAPAALPGVAYE